MFEKKPDEYVHVLVQIYKMFLCFQFNSNVYFIDIRLFCREMSHIKKRGDYERKRAFQHNKGRDKGKKTFGELYI